MQHLTPIKGIGILAATVLALSLVFFLKYRSVKNPAPPANTTQAQKKNILQAPTSAQPGSTSYQQGSLPSGQDKAGVPDTAPPPAATQGAVTPPTSQLNLVLIRAGQVGQSVQFKAYVEGAVTGTCTVTYSNPGNPTVTRAGHITVEQTGPTDCTGLDAPVTDFPAAGLWKAVLTVAGPGGDTAQLQQMVQVSK